MNPGHTELFEIRYHIYFNKEKILNYFLPATLEAYFSKANHGIVVHLAVKIDKKVRRAFLLLSY